jgi:hypothetical protein
MRPDGLSSAIVFKHFHKVRPTIGLAAHPIP